MPRKPKRHRAKSGQRKGRSADRPPAKAHPAHQGIRIETLAPHSGDTAFRFVLFIVVGEGTSKRRVDLGSGFGPKGRGRTGALHAARDWIDRDAAVRDAADEARRAPTIKTTTKQAGAA